MIPPCCCNTWDIWSRRQTIL